MRGLHGSGRLASNASSAPQRAHISTSKVAKVRNRVKIGIWGFAKQTHEPQRGPINRLDSSRDHDLSALPQGIRRFVDGRAVRLRCGGTSGWVTVSQQEPEQCIVASLTYCSGERSNLLAAGNNASTTVYADRTRYKGTVWEAVSCCHCLLEVCSSDADLACYAGVVQQGMELETVSGLHHSDSNAIAAALHIPAHPQGGQYGTAI